ncbi:Long-chain fatty acid transport protein 4 [Frankliniella fusca]|uniref:Very long-chain fatty acid transport protein n=1 Tax=Frankliniella fusca TaxID=407009 RepID=A0AAE1H9H9_9NEOP|nr:Long-chain fatty acid transport protein 4 [Frankliniella fusca]
MESVWQGRAAAAFVLLSVLCNWMVGTGTAGWARVVGILAAFFVTVVLQHWRRLYVIAKVLPRDLRFVYIFLRSSALWKRFARDNETVVSIVERHAREAPGATCFLFEDQTWTYRDVNAYSNRVARAFQRAGVRRGDVVAVVLNNRIEYICLWLGLAKLGAITALINRNLTDTPLAHSINTAKAKVVIFDEEYAAAVQGVRADLGTAEGFYRFGAARGGSQEDWFIDLQPLVAAESEENPVVDFTPGHWDHLMYIYTSGTTGLPKASIVTHARTLFWPLGLFRVANMDPGRDVFYCSLPMYHAAGGAYAASLALAHRVPVAFAPKFSASKFWTDCARHNATIGHYIGELCRFLVLSPESPADKQHKVHTLVGNGLSPAVWRRLRDRFGVDKVIEFYGSTEGNVMLVNMDQKIGALGFIPQLLPRSLWPFELVQVDEESGEPVRDDHGHCVRCGRGEAGMLIGRVREESVQSQFVGYLDREASEKKVLRNAFGNGDKYFMSGDMAVMDEYGYIYFKDRIGDTFRWKGENVSTAEVETIMTRLLLTHGVREVAVYGVQVPGNEGRAGMAAIADPERRCDLGELAAGLKGKLPAYARPVFVRVADSLPMTGTHKVSKVELRRQGFDPATCPDPVFVSRGGTYEPLSEAVLTAIHEGKARL